MQKFHGEPSLDMFRALCIGIDTPISLGAYLRLKYGGMSLLLELGIKPSEYASADRFAADYAVVNFLKKLPISIPGVDTRQAAIQSFKQTEAECALTNQIFDAWMDGGLCIPAPVEAVLYAAQRKIFKLLGPDVVFTHDTYSWGPGATSDLTRKEAYPDTKLTALPFVVTGAAWKHAAAMIASDLHWKEAVIAANPNYAGPIFKIVPGGRFDTVSKTALTDRSILVEPRLNTVLQKRAGGEFRGRLKTVGVNLDDQGRNQMLAEWAYPAQLATLDLSNASNTVSRQLVRFLLPPAWFSYLDDTRSKWALVDGDWVRLEMFSSMGNGFTFELESLIFWALASSVISLDQGDYQALGVFGDDIIVPQRVSARLIEVLTFCGFSVNKQKSFTSGVFFESCGKHFYEGYDVTPAYQRELLESGPEFARAANRLLRLAYRLGRNVHFDKRVRGAWEWARREAVNRGADTGPFIGVGEGYVEQPHSDVSSRTRSGPWGPRVKVRCFVTEVGEIPASDEALYCMNFWKPSQDPEATSYRALLESESLTQIQMRGKRVVVSYTSATPGCLPSRSTFGQKVKRVHRWVDYDPAESSVDW